MGFIQSVLRGYQIPTESKPFLGLLGLDPRSKTGLTIDADSALDATAVWSAVTQLSQSIASLPLHLYKRLEPRGKERFINHPVYRLLNLQPNQEMTTLVFREALMGQVLMFGAAFAEKAINNKNEIIALWPLLTTNMTVMRDRGQLVYRYQLPNGEYKWFPSDKIFKVIGFSANGLLGYRVYEKMVEPIGLSLALEEYATRFFGNGATPPAVLEHPEQLSPEAQDRLRDNWNKVYKGLSNAHRIAILEEGMKLHVFGITPEASQAIESRKFMVDEVARIFNMPPHMLKSLEHATYSNIEQQSLEFVKYTLRPWLVRFEQEYNTQLLKPVQQGRLFFEHLVDGLLRGDAAARHSAYTNGRQWGYYSANDIREFENLNPIEGGDIYMVPLNMVPADQIENPPEQEPTPIEDITDQVSPEEGARTFFAKPEYRKSIDTIKRIERSYKKLFQDAAQRIVNKEVMAVRKNVKGIKSKETFEKWLDNFYDGMPDYIRTIFRPVQTSLAEQVSSEAMGMVRANDIPPHLQGWVDEYLSTYSKRHIGSSLAQLKKILRELELDGVLEAIETRLDEWAATRPEKIARNETVRMSNFIGLRTWQGEGVTKKVWRTVGKSCPYCEKLDGKVVEIEKNFLDAGDAIHAQYDVKNEDGTTEKKWGTLSIKTNMAHPPVHQGCDCIVVPE